VALVLGALLRKKHEPGSSHALSLTSKPIGSKASSETTVHSMIDTAPSASQRKPWAATAAPVPEPLISMPAPLIDYVKDDTMPETGATRDDTRHAGMVRAWELLLAKHPTSVSQVMRRLALDTDPESVSVLQYVLTQRFSQSLPEAEAAELFQVAESDISPQNRQAIISLLSQLHQINPSQVTKLGQVARATANEGVKLEALNTMSRWMQKFPEQTEFIAGELVGFLKIEQSPAVTAQVLQTLATHATSLTADQQNAVAAALQSDIPDTRTHAAEALGAMTGSAGYDAVALLERAQAKEKDLAVSRIIEVQLARLRGLR
jgi:hypothetical protein